jgi:hypothetical protein
MDVTDTKPLEKSCSKCGEIKTEEKFIPKRNICKECRNKKNREKYSAVEIKEEIQQQCNFCNSSKVISCFIKNRKICKDCNNNKRKTKYETDEEHRKKLIALATNYKHEKIVEKKKQKEEEIGKDNKICSCCIQIKSKCDFRHNRLKCKDCERDEPMDKFKRTIRSRIISAIKSKNKHTIEYLGCNSTEYLKWMLNNDDGFTLENRGHEWHIDHVIPLAHFDLEKEEQQLIAFNWRNTMPLAAKKNLSKNRKIIISQVEQHYKKLVEYHKNNNIEMPSEFIDLFAT